MANIVDFHVHGIGSKYKDAFATASYDHICAYFQRLAENRHKDNVYVAFTEHDCSILTYQQYKDLQKKYPKVKIILGMESNTKLTQATNGVFEVAHVLAYADMSSDEAIKKWFDCKELNELSKIKTFQIKRQYPSDEAIIKNYCNLLNTQLGLNIDYKNIYNSYLNGKAGTNGLQNATLKLVAQKIDTKKDEAFKDCQTTEQVINKLKSKTFFTNKKFSIFAGLVPSQYGLSKELNIKLAIDAFQRLCGEKLNLEELKKEINFDAHANDLDSQFVSYIAKKLASNHKFIKSININRLMQVSYNRIIDTEHIENFINSQIFKQVKYNSLYKNLDKIFESQSYVENFGEKLYIAKSILNKNIGTNITNAQIAELLNHTKTREKMREHFVKLVMFSLKYRNPSLYNRFKKTPWQKFAKMPLGRNIHGDIVIDRIVPELAQTKNLMTTDVRTPLAEINEIVKKTGGHLVLAHPDVVFKYSNNNVIPSRFFKKSDRELLSKKKFQEIVEFCRNDGGVNTENLLEQKSNLLKLDLFFRLCQANGIKFDGFEITKSVLKDRENLRNQLIYAAKNNFDISFGSDAHLSNIHFYYDLFLDGKLSKEEFDELCDYADKIGDNTAELQMYKKYYPNKLYTDEKNINFATIKKPIKPIIKNNAHKLYNNNYSVEQTSFCDKILGKELSDALLTLRYNGDIYGFDKSALREMKYNFDIQNTSDLKKAVSTEQNILDQNSNQENILKK